MQALTSAILGAFVLYAASWYMGFVEGNFALLLFLASVVTGAYWVAERFYFLPRRAAAVAALDRGGPLHHCRHHRLLRPGIRPWLAEVHPGTRGSSQLASLARQGGRKAQRPSGLNW